MVENIKIQEVLKEDESLLRGVQSEYGSKILG